LLADFAEEPSLAKVEPLPRNFSIEIKPLVLDSRTVNRRILKQEFAVMLRHTKQRRTAGAVLVILGALLMWLAPGPTFTSQAATGLFLLLAGVVLELIGIALEHHDKRRP
jgi:hypothetical protein